jgi:DnaJ-class molecular chaperone
MEGIKAVHAAFTSAIPMRGSGAAMASVETEKKSPGDQVRPGTKQSGENICPRCKGTGRLDEKSCPDCGGSGKVIEIVGDA